MKISSVFLRLFRVILLTLIMNAPTLLTIFPLPGLLTFFLYLFFFASFIYLNLFPLTDKYPTRLLKNLSRGTELLHLFLITLLLNVALLLYFYQLLQQGQLTLTIFLLTIANMFLCEIILFWNGILRVYTTSVQLGIKWRIIGILLGFIPIANIVALVKICNITKSEVAFEMNKYELDHIRSTSEICKTKYPIVLVHGVFFRDSNLLNYWGRIPKQLMKNGATLYYGEQESAESVQINGAQLAEKIKNIIKESGCEKVNIIAHSKGGLDARYAISCLGMNQYVASLTTINTPHRGCIFVENLLHKTTPKLVDFVSKTYEKTFQKLGDKKPNFIAAVTDLTYSRCEELNSMMPDVPDVYYQSVGSIAKKARNGKFPLNISYPIVRHFDGENDGLVAASSSKWGDNFILLTPTGKRGITHADVIDLNRENIKGFDVREFYVNLVSDLKQRGF